MEKTKKIGVGIAMVVLGGFLIWLLLDSKNQRTNPCVVPSIGWLKVVEESQKTNEYNFSNKLLVATEKDLLDNQKHLTMPIQGEVEMMPNVISVFEEVTSKTVEVTAEFYEKYNSKRGAICTMIHQLENYKFPTLQAQLEMEQELLKMLIELGEIGATNPVEDLIAKANQILTKTAAQRVVMEQQLQQVKGQTLIASRGEFRKFNDTINFLEMELNMLKDGRTTSKAFGESLKEKEARLDTYYHNVISKN